MHIKVLFSRRRARILGARSSVLKAWTAGSILLAVAVQKGMTVYDLMELELAYAPPYGSGKDPINMVGLSGQCTGRHDALVHVSDLGEGDLILDVRTAAEKPPGSHPGCCEYSAGYLRDRLDELPKDKTIYPYCSVGIRSYAAVRIPPAERLSGKKYQRGYQTWHAASRRPVGESENAGRLKQEFVLCKSSLSFGQHPFVYRRAGQF